MAIKYYKPTTPGRRGMTSRDFDQITTSKPLRSLLVKNNKHSGRNNQGRITTRHKGGGGRRFYRIMNFKLAPGTEAVVEHIEYDPGRSAHIARIKDQDNKYHYILATNGMKIGHKIVSGGEASVESGNRMALKDIPVGSVIHAIEMKVGGGAQMVRSAGTSAQLMARDEKYAQVKLPSGEVRLVSVECTASFGVVSNEQHQNVKIGKAGANRHRGIRPTVRGVVMNAVDHPHGGGDGGRHGIGGGKSIGKSPKTPWGKKTLGNKTRRRKVTNMYIVRSRHKAKRK